MRLLHTRIFIILFFLSIVAVILVQPSNGYAADAAMIYAAKKDAIVVVINERFDSQENLEKERGQLKKPRRLFPGKSGNRVFTSPAVYRFVLRSGTRQATSYSIGTGFFIRGDGLIVTNAHVVQNSRKVTIETADGRSFPADIVGKGESQDDDIALVKIRANKTFPVLTIRQGNQPFVGERFAVIGHPLLAKYTLAEAMISRLVFADTLEVVQIQSSILPGNSGSPLLDQEGRVAGIVFGMIDDAETQGLAIPAGKMQRIIRAILAKARGR